MRNRLPHGCFTVDLKTVRATGQNDLPLLRHQLVAAQGE
jgi:uncharacterized protein with HEPN domain